jgi:hypothetical protein
LAKESKAERWLLKDRKSLGNLVVTKGNLPERNRKNKERKRKWGQH